MLVLIFFSFSIFISKFHFSISLSNKLFSSSPKAGSPSSPESPCIGFKSAFSIVFSLFQKIYQKSLHYIASFHIFHLTYIVGDSLLHMMDIHIEKNLSMGHKSLVPFSLIEIMQLLDIIFLDFSPLSRFLLVYFSIGLLTLLFRLSRP